MPTSFLSIDADGPAMTDADAAKAFSCDEHTIYAIRRRLVEHGFSRALERKKQDRPSCKRRLDGDGEAHLLKLACSKAPNGHARRTLKLLADKLVELEIVESISDQTVRRTLKKTKSSPTSKNTG